VSHEIVTTVGFGAPSVVDASLSTQVRGLVGSEILRIAAEIRGLVAAGSSVCNLTVGDFNPSYFPIPSRLLELVREAYDSGETNYPPSDGVLALRKAVAEFTARRWGARYPVESVLIASGARPILYGAYRCVLNRGDRVIYPVPSWNNNHYAWIAEAESVVVPTRPEDGFMPTPEQLAPHLRTARLLCLNSPLNPTGTVIRESALRAVLESVVEENRTRSRQGRPHLFVLHDQVYAWLVFGWARHHMPAALVPECAPWVITLDGISKGLAATGLRVGWVLAAPELIQRMNNLIGHIGAWAPRPEQVAVARFLDDEAACREFAEEMSARVRVRLERLHGGFEDLRRAGYPVRSIEPQGAIYLSVQFDLVGRSIAGQRLADNEAIGKLLLDRAGLGVVPFQAFGLPDETGWFRLSVGAVSLDDIDSAFPRVCAVLDTLD